MKDWIIDVESKTGGSKGLRNAYDYMLDPNRPSHKDTDIYVLGDKRAFQNTILSCEKMNSRPPKNLAISAVLSFPNDLPQPTVDEWQKISDLVLKGFCEKLNEAQQQKRDNPKTEDELLKGWINKREKDGKPPFTADELQLKLDRRLADDKRFHSQNIDYKELKKTTGSILHFETGGKSSHLNMLISTTQNGELIKCITQYSSVNSLKKAYNEAVKEVMGLDNLYYTPAGSRLPGQLAYDEKKLFHRKELKPEYTNREGEKVRKRRRRSPSMKQKKAAELAEREKAVIEQQKVIIGNQKVVLKNNEIIKKKEESALIREKNIEEREVNTSIKESQLNAKENSLERKERQLEERSKESVKRIYSKNQKRFKLKLNSMKEEKLKEIKLVKKEELEKIKHEKNVFEKFFDSFLEWTNGLITGSKNQNIDNAKVTAKDLDNLARVNVEKAEKARLRSIEIEEKAKLSERERPSNYTNRGLGSPYKRPSNRPSGC